MKDYLVIFFVLSVLNIEVDGRVDPKFPSTLYSSVRAEDKLYDIGDYVNGYYPIPNDHTVGPIYKREEYSSNITFKNIVKGMVYPRLMNYAIKG